MSDTKSHGEPEMKGWLCKWTNYLKGYQKRWFVLSNGFLCYYRNQAEMAHTCRGTISLHGALIHTEDACTFVISNGGTQTFHIKASNEVERQRWVTALELAKAKAIHAIESEEEEEDEFEGGQKCEVASFIRTLSCRFEDLKTCNELINKHGVALHRALSELETIDSAQDNSTKIKAINEKATLFRITSTAMLNASSDYLTMVQSQGKKWQKVLQHEREQKLRLEEMVEQLAKQHSLLEQAANHRLQKNSASPSTDDEDNTEFYDAQGEESGNLSDSSNFIIKIPNCQRRASSPHTKSFEEIDVRDEASGSSSEIEEGEETQRVVVITSGGSQDSVSHTSNPTRTFTLEEESDGIKKNNVNKRRTCVPNKPHYPLNLWSIMKNCIGKELTKIPMPVNFSEPLSMLQRLTEDYEYSDILDYAAQCKDSCEQLAYVAAFTVSSYSTTSNRTGKPFNPLLGETYECDRLSDLGWRAISEQVSHHPPMVAQYCEGRRWKCWQEFTMASKFRGKYLQVIPLGIAHLEFDSGNHYTWRKVTTTVHNIIVGTLWVDQHGDMDIINHTDASKCHLSYIPYSYFNRDDQRKVKGCVMDKDGKVTWIINGTWDNKIEIAPVISIEGTQDNPVYKTGPYNLAWERRSPPLGSEKYYNFTLLACQLNEPEDGVAPTDSRNRPDQRLMEEGLWDEANNTKITLEEKQRAARRLRESSAEKVTSGGKPYPPYEPVWFRKETDTYTGNIAHVYKGGYWECKEKQDWSACPNIF